MWEASQIKPRIVGDFFYPDTRKARARRALAGTSGGDLCSRSQ